MRKVNGDAAKGIDESEEASEINFKVVINPDSELRLYRRNQGRRTAEHKCGVDPIGRAGGKRHVKVSGNGEQRNGVALDAHHGDRVGALPTERAQIREVGIYSFPTVGANHEVVGASWAALQDTSQLNALNTTPGRPRGDTNDAERQADQEGKRQQDPWPTAGTGRNFDMDPVDRLGGLLHGRRLDVYRSWVTGRGGHRYESSTLSGDRDGRTPCATTCG